MPRWFGPKHFGWGWSPNTAPGRLVTGAYVVIAVGTAATNSTVGWVAFAVATAAFLAVVTGGRPGHRRR
jgi:hypothetical protein